MDRMRGWAPILAESTLEQRIQYLRDVNRSYDALANHTSAAEIVELRYLRSLWAKRIAEHFIEAAGQADKNDLRQICMLIAQLRTLLRGDAVRSLLDQQHRVGDSLSAAALCQLLSEHAIAEEARAGLSELAASSEWFLRLGPERLPRFRPSRKTGGLDPSQWLTQAPMTEVEFCAGDPDRVRVRGIELRSGDIGIVELNHPGDGLLESFLEQPGVAPHAMLYITRRVLDPSTSRILYQPSAVEIYEGGWRCIPITTALHPEFSWYSEWVRPNIGGNALPSDIGQRLSDAIDTMETFAFDFQARRVPTGGYFPEEFGGSCASCTNLIRVPFERAGIATLPYPVTQLVPRAARNLAVLGIPPIAGIHTPTNILNDSGFAKIGIVDNGEPEKGLAQALVVGRPDWDDTFGGWMSQKDLQLENLPNWKSVMNWKSAWEALRIRIGQSETAVGQAIRRLLQVEDAEVPKSVSDTTIAFYLRSDMEAGHIIVDRLYDAVVAKLSQSSELPLLSELRADSSIAAQVREGLLESALKKEAWYS